MKAMLGGCCVCADERGWAENPLVYCDGAGCSVAVHQACYGIVQVPTGPWFCRKCESQERTARVRCELCPSRDGALKRTDSGGWAHVVCALYIPEVRFENVSTMEPIMLGMVPQERYHKTCSLCTDSSHASLGACMQCNKTGCKQYFHVTCAQASGLLCEEAGNYMDNVKYCGYCHYHYQKLVEHLKMLKSNLSRKKDANIKIIPAFKPPSSNIVSDDDSDSPTSVPTTTSTTTTSRGRKVTPVIAASKKEKKQIYTSDSSDMDDDIAPVPVKCSPVNSKPSSARTDRKAVSASANNGKSSEKATVYDDPEFDDDSFGAKTKFESHKIKEEPKTSGKAKKNAAATTDKNSPANFLSMYDSLTKSSSKKTPQSNKRLGKDKDSAASTGPSASKRPKTPLTSSTAGAASNVNSSATSAVNNSTSSNLTSGSAHTSGQLAQHSNQSPKSAAQITHSSTLTFNHSNIKSELRQNGTKEGSGSAHESKDTRPLVGVPRAQRPQLPQPPPPTNFPTTLEQLLERQWDQGSSFLMKQAQHFDIAALLSCLHQLKTENNQLEDKLLSLSARRDHLLAVNARLGVPLGMLNATTVGQTTMVATAATNVAGQMIAPTLGVTNGVVVAGGVPLSTPGESRRTPPRASTLENGNATQSEKDRVLVGSGTGCSSSTTSGSSTGSSSGISSQSASQSQPQTQGHSSSSHQSSNQVSHSNQSNHSSHPHPHPHQQNHQSSSSSTAPHAHPHPHAHHSFVGGLSESAAAAMAANGRLPTLNYNYAAGQHKSKR